MNVLLSESSQPRVSDFGLSPLRLETQSKSPSESDLGTLAFKAPELFNLSPKYTGKSDVYSYAILLWELCTRQHPYEDVPTIGIREGVKSGERMSIPDEVPKPMRQLILDCWNQQPQDRPPFDVVIERIQSIVGTASN